ncbi:putative ribonuclease H protein [Glycine max]|nr:putative ribonuclease H protein [Glycine max]
MEVVKKLTEDVIRWNSMEDNYMMQKAKLDWLKMGDDNSAFFHAYVKTKSKTKSMRMVQTSDGTVLSTQAKIEQEVLKFYGNLMGKSNHSLNHIDIGVMRKGRQVNMEGDSKSVDMMLDTVQNFSDATGLVINPTKCKIFFGGIDDETKGVIKRTTNFKEGQFPIRYLGVPLTSKKLTITHYLPLVEKIVCRTRHWTARLLTHAGRIQLVKSISFSITQYWMLCFPIPKFVLKKIEAICRSFIWTGCSEVKKKSLVAWETVCRPKCQGGLDIINLTVTMMKCLWNLCRKSDNLWVKWIHMYYLKKESIMQVDSRSHWSWMFNNILDQREKVRLKQEWNNQMQRDKFSMKTMYNLLMDKSDRVPWRFLLNHNIARPQAIVNLWLTCQGRMATKDRLKRFGMIKENQCSLCKESEESIGHLFFDCKITKSIWEQILKWIEVTHEPKTWDVELKWAIRETGKKGWKAKLLKLALTETLYENNVNRNIVDNIIDNIVYRGWYNNKLRKHIVTLML